MGKKEGKQYLHIYVSILLEGGRAYLDEVTDNSLPGVIAGILRPPRLANDDELWRNSTADLLSDGRLSFYISCSLFADVRRSG